MQFNQFVTVFIDYRIYVKNKQRKINVQNKDIDETQNISTFAITGHNFDKHTVTWIHVCHKPTCCMLHICWEFCCVWFGRNTGSYRACVSLLLEQPLEG